jgi:hypothetical protein
MLGQPNARTDSVQLVPSSWPRLAAVVCGLGVLAMPFGLKYLVSAAASSTEAATGAKPSAAKEPLSEAPVIGSPVTGSPMLDPNEQGLAAAQSS